MSNLYAGISYKIVAHHSKAKSENIIAYVENLFGKGLYAVRNEEGALHFNLKEEYLQPQDFAAFLEHQFSIVATDGDQANETKKSAELIADIKKCADTNALLSYVKESYQYTLHLFTPEYIFTTIGFGEVRLDVSSLTYLSEGKISMECYYQFMNYLSALLKRESSAYKCAQAARIFIG